MAKRLRSLASLLWDDGEVDELPHERHETAGLGNLVVQHELKEQAIIVQKLKEENMQLRSIIKDLQCKAPVISAAPSVMKPSLMKRYQKDPWHWLDSLPASIAMLPRLKAEVCTALEDSKFASGAISFDLSPSQLASTVLGHAELVVRSFSAKHPALHKVGITNNPVQRWQNPSYGYAVDRHVSWDGMKIIFVHSSAQAVALLEASLIRLFNGSPGCRNVRMGGEGVDMQCDGPFFCYVTYKVLRPPPK